MNSVRYFTPQSITTVIMLGLTIGFVGCGVTTCSTLGPELMKYIGFDGMGFAEHMSKIPLTACVLAFVGSKLLDRIGPRWGVMIGVVTTALYQFIVGTTDNFTVYVWSAILGGIGMGLGSLTAIAGVVDQYFGEKYSGRIFGVQMAFMVVGSAAILAVVSAALNTGVDYHTICIVQAACCLVIGVVTVLFFTKGPSSQVAAEIAEQKHAADEAKASESKVEKTGLTIGQAIKTPALWVMGFAMMIAVIMYSTWNSYGTVFFTSFGMTTATAAGIMAFNFLFQGVNTLWTPFVQTKLGSKWYFAAIFGLIMVGLVIMFVWTKSQAYLLALAGLFFAGLAKCVSAIPATVIPTLFGEKDFVGINSFLTAMYYVGVVLNSYVSAYIIQFIGAQYAVVYMAVACLVAFALFMLAYRLAPMRKLAFEDKVEKSTE